MKDQAHDLAQLFEVQPYYAAHPEGSGEQG